MMMALPDKHCEHIKRKTGKDMEKSM